MNSKQKEIKQLLGDFLESMKDLSSENQQVYRSFQDLVNSINNPGGLDEKVKVLMGVAIATYSTNQESLVYHINEAFKLGATEDEITEAAMVSIISGGIGSMAFFVTFAKDAIQALKGK